MTDGAYEAIRRAILHCELEPGDQISEVQLSEGFGFTRAAVRAALIRLCHDRLLRAIPRHGYEVAAITFQDVHDLFGMRRIIEPAAAALAAGNGGDASAAALDDLNAACAVTAGQNDPIPLREANKAFHLGLARLSGNSRLGETTRVVMDEIDRVLYLPQLAKVRERIDATFAEHGLIIAAIRAGDPAGAEAAALDHIRLNQRFVLDGLSASPQLRSINLGRG